MNTIPCSGRLRQFGTATAEFTYATARDRGGGVILSGWTDGSRVVP